MANKALDAAKKNKADEFYTQLPDIEKELRHYAHHFAGKVIFCNCDDPYESNFFKYFAMNFNYLKLKKLIATCYVNSPVAGEQFDFFDKNGDGKVSIRAEESTDEKSRRSRPHKIVITEVKDENGDGAIDLADVEILIRNRKNVLTVLDGDGDFRSAEYIELLKEADIVVTNPPFSLFREYVKQLMDFEKKFVIIGNKNAITYKEIFHYIKDNLLWLGQRDINKDMWFRVPENESCEKVIEGLRLKHIMGCWFTNLDIPKRHERLTFDKSYTPEEYPKYDNYDAINVNKVAEIPYDYDGVMGVPITFLDKHNPEQFELVDALNRYALLDVAETNEEVRKNRSHTCNINGKSTYFRIVIKRKEIE